MIRNQIKKIAKSKKGGALWESVIVFGVLLCFIYSTVVFFGAYIQFEDFTYAAKTVTRDVETTGVYNPAVHTALFTKLLSKDTMHDASVSFEENGTTHVDEYKLPLRSGFSMTYKVSYTINLLGGSLHGNGNDIMGRMSFEVPMQITIHGMSEVK